MWEGSAGQIARKASRVPERRTGLLAQFCALAVIGCSLNSPTSATQHTPKEDWAISEVARLATKLTKPYIKAEFQATTRHISAGVGGCPADAPQGCDSAAWFIPYEGPVVWWTSWINRDDTTLGNISDAAAHEVCHSLSLEHGPLLYNCIRSLGQDPQFTPHD